MKDAIKKALDGIELNEEQIANLEAFFTEYKEELRNEFIEEMKSLKEEDEKDEDDKEVDIDKEKYILKEDAKKAFNLFEKDSKKAFTLFEEDAEKAFDLFEEDAEKAFDLALKDTQDEYTENMAQALQEVYEEIEERVKTDFTESKEFKTIQNLKDLIIPLLEDSDSDLVERIKKINEEKEEVEAKNMELTKENTISTLVQDVPKEYGEAIKTFIEKGKDENEVIERFNAISDIIEAKLNLETDDEEIEDDDDEEIEDKDKKDKKKRKKTKKSKEEPIEEDVKGNDVDYVFEYETLKEKQEQDESKLTAFTEAEEAALKTIGLV